MNNRGFTLIELMISIAILSIIAAPFVASSVQSTVNNKYAEDKLQAANAAQKTMEGIKALKADLLEEEALKFDGIDDYFELYSVQPDDTNLYTEYRVETLHQEGLEDRDPGDENTYSSFTVTDGADLSEMDYDMDFSIADAAYDVFANAIKLNTTNPISLADPTYYLYLSGTVIYTYSLKDSSLNELYSGNLNISDDNADIRIKFSQTAGSTFELHVNKASTMNKNVAFYVQGDGSPSRLHLINDTDYTVRVYDNLSPTLNPSTTPDPGTTPVVREYANVLYKIKVNVFKTDGSILESITSYVKK